MSRRILVIEDEEKLRRVVQLQLQTSGYEVELAATAEEGVAAAERADLVLTDLRLPGMSGLEFLDRLHLVRPGLPVVMMTAFGSVETKVEAMKKGAADFLVKPFSLDHLTAVVEKALEFQALREENKRLKEELGGRYQLDSIVGRSAPMQDVFAMVLRAAPTR